LTATSAISIHVAGESLRGGCNLALALDSEDPMAVNLLKLTSLDAALLVLVNPEDITLVHSHALGTCISLRNGAEIDVAEDAANIQTMRNVALGIYGARDSSV
jgi:hypothetical protein